MRRALAAVVASLALLLAGCSEIPSSGPVRAGSTEGPNDTRIVYFPSRPEAGASPREIVSGFLTAASAGGRFTVAKEFLTRDAASTWRPGAQVLVQEGQARLTERGRDEITASIPLSATVTDTGAYAPASGVEPLDFHVVQVGGQWRIDRLPDGIVLGQIVFQKLYTPRTLSFFDPTYSHLVPDLRWLPIASSTGATTGPADSVVVDRLIGGPVGPLGDGVAANALAGATARTVTSDADGVVTVVLSVDGAVDGDRLARMQQQLVQSLQLPAATALRLIVNGRFAGQDVKALADQPAQLAYVVKDGRFGTLDAAGAFTEEASLGRRIVATGARAITVSTRQRFAAVLDRQGRVSVVTAGGARAVDSRPGLVAPTVDQRGWTYSAPEGDPTGLEVFSTSGRRVAVPADLGGTSVLAIEVSPDGTRMLVLSSSASGPQAFVAGILRAADGTPVGLSNDRYPVSVGSTGDGLDATWVDDGDVAVLTRSADGSVDRVQVQQLGGLDSPLGQLASAASLVGTTGEADLRARLRTGDLWVWTGNIWKRESGSSTDVSVLAVQR